MKKTDFKIGDTRLVEGQEYICKGITSSGKPIWRKNGEKQEEAIQKGYNVGDEKDFNGRTYYCAELNAKGQPKWRLKDKKGGSKSDTGGAKQATTQKQGHQGGSAAASTKQDDNTPQKKIEDMNPNELIEYAKNASTDALSKLVNDTKADKDLRQLAYNELKTRKDYDKSKVNSSDLEGGEVSKPTPKIQYKTKKPEVELPELKDYIATSKSGEQKIQHISTIRKIYAKRTDDELLNTLNNRNAKWQLRQVAYDEAAARGIPEDKINIKGTLQLQWKKEKEKKDIEDSMNKEFNEDEAIELSYDWKGKDPKEYLEQFDDGLDTSWLDPNSEKVKKVFKTDTLSGRQLHDTFKDYYQRDPKLVPGYLNAQNKVNDLYGMMLNWAEADSSPLFISAGGAGAGKTFGWKEIAKYLSLPKLNEGDDPSNTDWGYVMLTDDDAADAKTLSATLAEYNGTWLDDQGNERPHVLFFDDADKLLTTGQKDMLSLIKKINDGDPENRVFKNPKTGKQEVWKGKIIVTTNKDIAALSKNEDFKAIQSRAMVNNILFTRNETMELLAGRYMKMDLSEECTNAFKKDNYTEEEIEDFRQDVFDYMQEHLQEADPRKFTPRAFLRLCEKIAPVWKSGSKVVKTGMVNAGTDIHWRKTALSLLKAEENDIEKGDENSIYSKSEMIKRKEELEKTMAEAKKNGSYERLFGRKAQDLILFGVGSKDEDEDDSKKSNKKTAKKKAEKKADDKKAEDAEKGFDNEMSLDEAESILFS